MDELHDVAAQTPSNNHGLSYNSTNSLWENKSIATALGYTPANAATTLTINGVTYDLSTSRTFTVGSVTGSGASGQVAYWTGTSAQSGSNNLFWDNANARLGIGTNTPDYALKVVKSLAGGYEGIVAKNSSATGTALLSVQGSAASGNDITIFCGSPSQTFRTTFGLTGNYGELTANTANGFVMGTFSATPFILGTNDTQRLRIFGSTGNVLIQNGGTFTDGGQRLQVNGDAFIKGSGATSGTNALQVQNSAGTNILRVYNHGWIRLGNTNSSPLVFPQTNTGTGEDLAGTNLSFYSYTGSQSASSGRYFFGGENMVQTTGANYNIYSRGLFFPTSGTAAFADIIINPQINQTGGANGITRGLYVAPTLTNAFDWRSIQWDNNSGWGLYGVGTANNYLGGNLLLGSTTSSGERLQVQGTTLLNGNVTFSSATGMFWDATNSRLGIGTNAPANELSIVGNKNGVVAFSVSNSNTGTGAATAFNFGQSPNSSPYNAMYVVNYGSGWTSSGSQIANSNVISAGSGSSAGLSFVINNTSASIRYFGFDGSTQVLRMQMFNNGNLLLQNGGTFTDSGERLQVTGTMKVTGNINLLQNHNLGTTITLQNTTAGTGSSVALYLNSTSNAQLVKYSSSTTSYKIFLANDLGFYNQSAGDISILNDFATGNIKFAAGGSSTPHMTIKSNGRINMSSLPTSSTGLATGDLWNDAGTIKIV
jgi:hypothetical protein